MTFHKNVPILILKKEYLIFFCSKTTKLPTNINYLKPSHTVQVSNIQTQSNIISKNPSKF